MKKTIFIILAFMSFSLNLSAQYDQDQIIKEMEKMQEELMKQFEGLNFNPIDPQMQMDTFFFKGFGNGEDWMQLDGGSIDLTEMMNLFQQQLQQMDAQDWEELGEIFKGFGDFGPLIPAPDSLDNVDPNQQKEGTPSRKPKKKRKVYTL